MAANKRWLLGGLFAAAGVGLVLVHRRPKIRKDSRVLLVGDSLAAGLNMHLRGLAAEEGVNYQGIGKVGTRIDEWARSGDLDRLLRDFRPTLTLVSLGTNDEYLGPTAVQRQSPYLDALLAKLKAAGTDVVWIGVPTLPRANGIAELVASKAPHQFPSRSYNIPRGPDQIHPTAAGYAGWAGAIWRWLT